MASDPSTPSAPPFPRDAGPILLTTEAARRQLSCGKTTLFALIRDGSIETVKVGSRRRVIADSLRRYVEELRTAGEHQTHHDGAGSATAKKWQG